jgi:hypothetical protein
VVVDGGVAAVHERALPWRRESVVVGFRFRFQFSSVQVDGEEVVGDGGDGRPPSPHPWRRRQWRRDDALGEWEWEWLRRAGSEGTAAATETAG